MKNFWLTTVGLAALGLATPASAADLAARPFTKAPPPASNCRSMTGAGFYFGAQWWLGSGPPVGFRSGRCGDHS